MAPTTSTSRNDQFDFVIAGAGGMPADVQTVGAATFTLGETGEMSWSPGGAGWRWVYGAMLGEVLLSQQTGSGSASSNADIKCAGRSSTTARGTAARSGTTPEHAA